MEASLIDEISFWIIDAIGSEPKSSWAGLLSSSGMTALYTTGVAGSESSAASAITEEYAFIAA